MLPAGTYFRCLDSASVSENGENLIITILCTDGSLVAINLPLHEIERRAVLVMDPDHGRGQHLQVVH